MKNDKKMTVLCLRLSIILVFCIGVVLCAYWLPFRIYKVIDITGFPALFRLCVYWAASVPVFAVLIIGWKIVDNVKDGTEFSAAAANRFKLASKLLFADSVFFLVMQSAASFIEWSDLDILFFTVGVSGLIASLVAFLISRYVRMASEIKEENESIL